MVDIKQFNPQYITNDSGEKTAIILSISNFQELIEDIEDLAAVAERREEPVITHEKLVEELNKDGLL